MLATVLGPTVADLRDFDADPDFSTTTKISMYGRYLALACRGQRHGPGPTSYVLFNLPLSLSPELVQPSIVVESRSVSEKSVMYRYLK